MDLSVLIPTCNRTEQLRTCLAALASQTLAAARFEVLIGVDGPDRGEASVARLAFPQARVLPGPHAGPGATRNRLLQHARGRIALFLNDDVAPHPECLAAHLCAHDRPALILGAAPWKIHSPDRFFDCLIRSTSMIFFYDQMTDSDPARDWGFRHAWTLNLSVPASLARDCGGFNAALGCACYEDLEWAWRLSEFFRVPVLYRPEAVVTHDHRYEPAQYLARERTLGREAFALAIASPGCARAIFGRDIATASEIHYSQAFVEREARVAQTLERSFLALAGLPASLAEGPHGPAFVTLAYQQHLLLKRWTWRRGLLEAAREAVPAPRILQVA